MSYVLSAEDRARNLVNNYVPSVGIFDSSHARAMLRDLIEHQIELHARLALQRARKERRK